MAIESTRRLLEPPIAARLGAQPDGGGTSFAIFSSAAEAVELCLFDDSGAETRYSLEQGDGFVWESYAPGVRPGQRYGFRVHGAWDPASGVRCNAAKLLLDPYARAVAGSVRWHPAVFGHAPDDPGRADGSDSAPYVPRSLVVGSDFDWGDDRPPGQLAWHVAVDTADPAPRDRVLDATAGVTLAPRSLVLLRGLEPVVRSDTLGGEG